MGASHRSSPQITTACCKKPSPKSATLVNVTVAELPCDTITDCGSGSECSKRPSAHRYEKRPIYNFLDMSKKTNNCSGTITLRGAPQSYTRIRQDNLPNLSVYLRDPSVYLRVTL